MSNQENARKVEIEIEIPATPEEVFRGLTEAEQIMRWFAPIAEVKPGVGGTVFVSWGPGMEGTGRIEAWEPGKHFRYVAPASPETIKKLEAEGYTGSVDCPVDYFIETRNGKTYLRLVQSGFGSSSAWDGEYEGTSVGWSVFLRNLKHTVAVHPGKPNIGLMHYAFTPLPIEDAYRALIGGLATKGSLEGLKEGDQYSVETANGEKLSGTVELIDPKKGFMGTVNEQNNALVGTTLMKQSAGTMVGWGALVYDMTPEQAEQVKQRWVTLLNTVFPASQPAGMPCA
jgi:uncharacterized protein YndB with AHSA1/START domain